MTVVPNTASRKEFRGPRVVIRPTVLVFALLLLADGCAAFVVHDISVRLGGVALAPISAGLFVLSFAAGLFGLTLVHELGHVVGYWVLGLPWDVLTFAALPSVASRSRRSFKAQLLISAAGPVAQVITSGLILVLAGNPLSLVGLIGAFGLVYGVVGLLPFGRRNSDSRKIYRSLWAIVRGRGGRPVTW